MKEVNCEMKVTDSLVAATATNYKNASCETKELVDNAIKIAREEAFQRGFGSACLGFGVYSAVCATMYLVLRNPLKKFINQNLMQTKNGKKL